MLTRMASRPGAPYGKHQRHRLAPDPVNPNELVFVPTRMPAHVRAKARRLAEARKVSIAGLLADLVTKAEEPEALPLFEHQQSA